MNKTKRNHYLPEKLSGAWRYDRRHIFQLDKSAPHPAPISVSTKDAGIEKFLYSPEVEDFLRRHVEPPAWRILDRLRKRSVLDLGDMEDLLVYMASQIGRTPSVLRGLEERKPAMKSKIFETWAREGEGIVREEGDEEIVESVYHEAISRAIIGQTPQIVGVMQDMTWKVLCLRSPGELITSDHPVIKIGERLTDPGAAIFFPISPALVLVGLQGVGAKYTQVNGIWVPERRVRYEPVDASYSKFANVEIARQASRFLYGQSEEALISAAQEA